MADQTRSYDSYGSQPYRPATPPTDRSNAPQVISAVPARRRPAIHPPRRGRNHPTIMPAPTRCAAPTSSPSIWSRRRCRTFSAMPATAPSGCSTGSTNRRPHPPHLAAHRTSRRLHGRRLLSPHRPAARGLCLHRPRAHEPDDLGGQCLLRRLGLLRHYRKCADQPAQQRGLAGRLSLSRRHVLDVHPDRQEVVAHSQGRGSGQGAAERLFDDAHRPAGPGAFRHALRSLYAHRPGLDARAERARRAAQLAHDGCRRDRREGAQPSHQFAAAVDPCRRRRARRPRLRRAEGARRTARYSGLYLIHGQGRAAG